MQRAAGSIASFSLTSSGMPSLDELLPAFVQWLFEARVAIRREPGNADWYFEQLEELFVRSNLPIDSAYPLPTRFEIARDQTVPSPHFVRSNLENDVAVSRGRRHPILSRSHLALAKRKILDNLDGHVSITEVARACGLSRGYFISAFRETTGQTPHRWIMSQRIERANELLLKSDQSLADVALTCGFADQSHFTRVFSQIVGVSPGAWRRAARA